MGATFQENTATTYQRKCTADADCNAASTTPLVAAATTDTEKANRCCMYMGFYTTVPNSATSSQAVTAAFYIASMNTYWGMPTTVNNYTLVCNNAYKNSYPISIGILGISAVTGVTWDSATNVATWPTDQAGW